jgi:rhamnosyltransferase
MSATSPITSVVIPTLNGGPLFREVLERVLGQKIEGEVEVLVVDSGSTDGTPELARSLGARVVSIDRKTFNHGLTRNRGIAETRGELVALLVQDATPADDRWLGKLIEAMEADPRAAGAYSRQLPREDCNPFIRGRLLAWTAGKSERVTQSLAGEEEWQRLAPLERLSRIAFDDVSSMIRRSVWKEHPYLERDFGEDLCYARRTLFAGHTIVFEPGSRVIHSHDNSIWYELRRLYADHHNLERMVGLRAVPSVRELLRAIPLGTRHYGRIIREDERLGFFSRAFWLAKTVPFSCAEAVGKYLGGKADRWIPRSAFFRFLDRRLRRGV